MRVDEQVFGLDICSMDPHNARIEISTTCKFYNNLEEQNIIEKDAIPLMQEKLCFIFRAKQTLPINFGGKS
jgi:hypothetical protein